MVRTEDITQMIWEVNFIQRLYEIAECVRAKKSETATRFLPQHLAVWPMACWRCRQGTCTGAGTGGQI